MLLDFPDQDEMGYVQRGVAIDPWWLSSCCFELRQGVEKREG